MYSPAEQRNAPLIAGNVKGKIFCFFFRFLGLVNWGLGIGGFN